MDDASLPFERVEQAYENSVYQDMADEAVDAAEGYTQTDVAKAASRIANDTEKLTEALISLPSPVEACADIQNEWAATVSPEWEGWMGDASLRRVVQERSEQLRNIWKSIEPDLIRLDTKDGYKPIQSMLESLFSEAHTVVMEGGDIRKATRRVAETLADSGGVRIVSNGRSYELFGYVRQRVWDSWHDTMQDYRDRIGRKLGMDAVEVSAHGLCAPDHQPFQGKIYRLSDFDVIQSSLPRPIGKWNCRHIVTPCWSDSEPTYTRDDLAEMDRLSSGTVQVDGREMTRYEASQWQRSKELQIRNAKMNMRMCMEVDDREGASKWRREARKLSKEYRDGSESAGLRPQPARLTVGSLR